MDATNEAWDRVTFPLREAAEKLYCIEPGWSDPLPEPWAKMKAAFTCELAAARLAGIEGSAKACRELVDLLRKQAETEIDWKKGAVVAMQGGAEMCADALEKAVARIRAAASSD